MLGAQLGNRPDSGRNARWSSWGSDLCHPVPMAAVAVLVLNDHLLKGGGIVPGWLTGKLSDFAGLFFFPLLCVALVQGAWALALQRPFPRPIPLRVVAVVATGLVFGAAKTWPAFNAAFAPLWGQLVLDPTDLLALPMLGLSGWWLAR